MKQLGLHYSKKSVPVSLLSGMFMAMAVACFQEVSLHAYQAVSIEGGWIGIKDDPWDEINA